MISIMSEAFHAMFAAGRTFRLAPGAMLFRTGAAVTSVYLVTDGLVELVRHTEQGARLVLARMAPGQIVAEASVYARSYHCDGLAVRPSILRGLPLAQFRAGLQADPPRAEAWAAHLARALQASRLNAEIRTLRTVSERLDAWLASGGRPPQRGDIQGLAQRLGVTREALYRELARRRRRTPT